MPRVTFCPKCKRLKTLYSVDYEVIKYCDMCGCALYKVKEINGTTVNCEEL